MLLYGICLVPMVLATLDGSTVKELTVNKFILKIEDNILKNIRTTDGLSFKLDLSGQGIHGIGTNAFENVSHVKNLNLENNQISTLHESAFASLKDLKHLSVADNRINSIDSSTFSGLDNLTSLNISNNLLEYLSPGAFEGLGKFTDIITLGNKFGAMSTRVFKKSEQPRIIERHLETSANRLSEFVPTVIIDYVREYHLPSLLLEVCIREGVLEKLEAFTNTSELEPHCKIISADHTGEGVILRRLGISKFSAGWYQIRGYPISSLNLEDNNIIDVSSEMLNDLPKELRRVNLSRNKIETLTNGTIVNEHLLTLDFAENAIRDIEDNVFKNTKLQDLVLSSNRLRNTKFTATLPPTLIELKLDENHIDELSSDFCSGLETLQTLTLTHNNITELKAESLRRPTAVLLLDLSDNDIRTIEKGSFRHLKFLTTLNLVRNNLTSLDKGVFDGLLGVDTIDLSSNKLTRITRESLEGISHLSALRLSFNQIETLEAGTFVNLPSQFLFLDNNKIKNIEDGTFDIESLYELNLKGNLLDQLNGELFNGIKALSNLDLGNNGITKIQRASLQNLNPYGTLRISGNPITRLENGAFLGLSNDERRIELIDVPIELIQGGAFDDL